MWSFPVDAVDSSDENPKADHIMSKMKERLKLTEDQETKVRPIIQDFFDKAHQIIDNTMLDTRTKVSSLQQLQWSTDIRLSKILTDEQMEEYKRSCQVQTWKMLNYSGPHGGNVRNGGSRVGWRFGF